MKWPNSLISHYLKYFFTAPLITSLTKLQNYQLINYIKPRITGKLSTKLLLCNLVLLELIINVIYILLITNWNILDRMTTFGIVK